MRARQQVRLSEAIDQYLLFRRARYAPSTVDNEAFVLTRFASWYGRDVYTENLSARRIEEWFYGPGGLMTEHRTRDGLVRAPIQPSTHNFYRLRLASFFRFLTARGMVRCDLLASVEPMTIVRKQRQQPMPHLMLSMIESADNDRDRIYLAMSCNTGLRAGEISPMRVGDVDLAGGSIKVFISKSKEQDELPITADLDSELRRWLTSYSVTLGRTLRDDDHLFPAKGGGRYFYVTLPDGTRERRRTETAWIADRPVTKTERIVQNALISVGLPHRHEGTHTLRRAVARHMFDRLVEDKRYGYDGALRTVSALLHHKNSTTTEHYLGLSSEKLRRDQAMRGQPFLSAMVKSDNVVPLRRAIET